MNKTNKILKNENNKYCAPEIQTTKVCPSCSKTTFSFCHLVQHNPKSKT